MQESQVFLLLSERKSRLEVFYSLVVLSLFVLSFRPVNTCCKVVGLLFYEQIEMLQSLPCSPYLHQSLGKIVTSFELGAQL